MESAIDVHLRCPRTLSRRVSDGYTPDYPRYVARGNQALRQVVTAYFGVQYGGTAQRASALATLRHIVGSFGEEDGPQGHELPHHVDGHDLHNLIAVAHWSDPASYRDWESHVGGWWASEERLDEGLGYFREIVAPRVEQLETLYASTDDLPGVGAVFGGFSGEVEEHGYWGAIRDRVPLSQTDRLEASGALEVLSGNPAERGRVVVRGHDNLTLIRSGQIWEGAGADERDLYFDDLLPTLGVGMAELDRIGPGIGCYSSRFVRSIDIDGNELDETYNIGHWRSLSDLERWAETNRAHLQLFVRFLSVRTRLDRLRFYQEALVSDRADQTFEYINCHPDTGRDRGGTRSGGAPRPTSTHSSKAARRSKLCGSFPEGPAPSTPGTSPSPRRR